MPSELSALLRQTIERELPQLRALSELRASSKPNGPDSWSPKQELGHLIDSAANNHIRFVRAATELEFQGSGYAQNVWVDCHHYQELPWGSIIDFWYQYNSFLVPLLERIPAEKLGTKCFIGNAPEATLKFVIEDYVLHMQHHIDHLLSRPVVTEYPAKTAAQA
jgi:hypothetical protein